MSSPLTHLVETNGSHSSAEGKDSQLATVTVIVPIRNEEKYIANTLDQLLAQQRRGVQVEILVVDGRSTDKTREIVSEYAERFPEIRLLDNPKKLSSAARNVAIKHSTSEYLVVIDGHCEIPTNTYFLDLVDAFQRTGADCLGRPQPLDITDSSILQQAIAAARDSRLGHHPDSYIYSQSAIQVPAISVAVAYRRKVFQHVGLFDTCFDACEDCELNYRIDKARMTCFLEPRLAVRYQPRDTLSGLFKQMARYGRGRVRLFRKHPEVFSFPSILPALMLVGGICGFLLCCLVPDFWSIYMGLLFAYTFTVLVTSLLIVIRIQNHRLLLWVPLIFLCVHIGAGWGVLKESIFGKWGCNE